MIVRRFCDHHPDWYRSLLYLCISLTLAVMWTALSSAGMVGIQQQAHAATAGNAVPPSRICYQAHVQNIGWQGTVCNGQQAGTTGQSLRMEAVQIFLVRR
jgi:hypothetical protein